MARTTAASTDDQAGDTKQTVAILGPGAVGGLVAGLLVRAGHRVICVARERTADALRERGLSIRSPHFGNFVVPVTTDTALRESVAACVVTAKEATLTAALRRVPPESLGDGLVLPLLSGLEHVRLLRERYGAGCVVPGTIRVDVTRPALGVVEQASPFPLIELASRTAPPKRVAALAALLSDAGLAVTVRCPEEEDQMLWDKLTLLLLAALFTTRYAASFGEIRTAHRAELLAMVHEVARVGRADGVRIDVDQVMRLVDVTPAGMRSAMLRDAQAGRPLELDAIGGALLRAAARHGLAAPVTARLVTEIGGGLPFRDPGP